MNNAKNYLKKIRKSKILSDKAKQQEEELLRDLENLHKECDKDSVANKKEMIRREVDALKQRLGII